jgi:GNAT superfamily N-acetyltransferase
MRVSDFRVVECAHWESAEQVLDFAEMQGIASMLAFEGERYLGQLYLQEYDPQFRDPIGWEGHRPWADFHLAEPLGLEGRFLTLGCYHVGWMPDDSRDTSLYGKGIGTALLGAVVQWYQSQTVIDGLLTWALPPERRQLLVWAGQMPFTLYRRFGFRELKQVDPQWDPSSAGDKTLFKVMLLTRR